MTISEGSEDTNLEGEISSSISEEQWQSLIEHVPKLEELRARSLDHEVPPTAVLGQTIAQIGMTLPVGTRMQGFAAKRRASVVSYMVLIGRRASGKSSSGDFMYMNGDYPQIYKMQNPTSGGAIASAFLRTKVDDVEDPDEVNFDSPIEKPHGAIVFDEGRRFDDLMAGKHGDNFAAAVTTAWEGEAEEIGQVAATDAANRELPSTSQVAISMVLRTQPGYASEVLEDMQGFGSRWVLFYISPDEVDIGLDDDAVEHGYLLDGWVPNHYPDNTIPMTDELARTAKILARYARDVHKKRSPKDQKILDSIDQDLLEMVRNDTMGHIVLKAMRVAGALAVYERATHMEIRHLLASSVLMAYSNTVAKDYGEYLSVLAEIEEAKQGAKLGALRNHANNANTDATVLRLDYAKEAANKVQQPYTSAGIWKTMGANRRAKWADDKDYFIRWCLENNIIIEDQRPGKRKKYCTVIQDGEER